MRAPGSVSQTPYLTDLVRDAQTALDDRPENPWDNADAWLRFRDTRIALHTAYLLHHGFNRRVVAVPGDGDCLWHAISESIDAVISPGFLRAAVMYFMRTNPNWSVPSVECPLWGLVLNSNAWDADAYTRAMDMFADPSAQFDREAIVIASHLLGVPIAVIRATELQDALRTPGWDVEDASAGDMRWNRDDASAANVLLLHHNNHFDAAIPVAAAAPPVPLNTRPPVRDVNRELRSTFLARLKSLGFGVGNFQPKADWPAFKVAGAHVDQALWGPISWEDLRKVHNNVADATLQMGAELSRAFRATNFDASHRYPDEAMPGPRRMDWSFVCLSLMRFDASFTGVTLRAALPSWVSGLQNTVIILPLVVGEPGAPNQRIVTCLIRPSCVQLFCDANAVTLVPPEAVSAFLQQLVQQFSDEAFTYPAPRVTLMGPPDARPVLWSMFLLSCVVEAAYASPDPTKPLTPYTTTDVRLLGPVCWIDMVGGRRFSLANSVRLRPSRVLLRTAHQAVASVAVVASAALTSLSHLGSPPPMAPSSPGLGLPPPPRVGTPPRTLTEDPSAAATSTLATAATLPVYA